MDVLLKLKHWHVFLLTCAAPLINGYIAVSFMFELPRIPLGDFGLRVLQFMEFGSGLLQLAWLYVAALKLNEQLQPEFQRPTSSIKTCVAAIAIWTVLSSVPGLNLDFGRGFSLILLVVTLSLYISCELFVARALVRAEGENESVGGTFVLIFFLPIGIWWVQPRINRVFSSDWGNINPDAPLDHNLGQQS